MTWARSPEASFTATMLSFSRARARAVGAAMLDAVRPGTLYSTTGTSAMASATARKCAWSPAWVGLL